MSSPSLGIFPKFLKDLSVDTMMGDLGDCGIDAVNAVIRDGFWTVEEDLSSSLSSYVKRAQETGLQCDFATWAIEPEKVLGKGEVLSVMADAGLRGYRTGYFDQRSDETYPEALRRARSILEAVVELSSSKGLRVVVQVHHGRLMTNPESMALLVEGFDPQQLGVMLDVGNQGFEGHVAWDRADNILAGHWTDLGVKDTAWVDG